ncbi:DUF192 domain-containing protein [uncultured Parvibaculum sp.]|uniref:DUF192 domain-containing protein n=1 Tax=uncultured Parvibaculum sp. TaxID=291828 RepID=UPI0030EC45BE|tara:strand:- start:80042 stop:80545 length:504 start_codon:yes stop_codon:yes gene_type:complete
MRAAALLAALLTGLTLFACVPPARAGSALTIETAAGATHRFTVELAVSPAEIQRGLMFRESLADDAGMLFFYQQCRLAQFWMKNTLIPLDMIFIEADGRIARITAMAEPQSLEIRASGVPVNGVLEIAGGRAAALGIAPGDHVRHPLFGADGAAVCGEANGLSSGQP